MISKVQPEKKEREAKFQFFSTEIEYFVLLHSPQRKFKEKFIFSREEKSSESNVSIGKVEKPENPSNVQNL